MTYTVSCCAAIGVEIDNPEMIVNGNDVVAWGYKRIRISEVLPQASALVVLKLRYEDGTATAIGRNCPRPTPSRRCAE